MEPIYPLVVMVLQGLFDRVFYKCAPMISLFQLRLRMDPWHLVAVTMTSIWMPEVNQ